MPRIRNEEAGAIHHVFARGVLRSLLFIDDEDYERYIRLLRATIQRYEWNCLAFCLMPNHVHLIIETPEPNLGDGMRWLHSLYAVSFNERHGRSGQGHVFQGPYGSRRVFDDAGFLRVAAYVVMNAVTSGLARKPSGWRWSSHGLIARDQGGAWLAHDRFEAMLESLTGRADYLSTIVL